MEAKLGPIRRELRPHAATTGDTGSTYDWWFSLDGEWWVPVSRKPTKLDLDRLILIWENRELPRTSRAYLEAAFPRTVRYHS
jgi:hypothetical protein